MSRLVLDDSEEVAEEHYNGDFADCRHVDGRSLFDLRAKVLSLAEREISSKFCKGARAGGSESSIYAYLLA